MNNQMNNTGSGEPLIYSIQDQYFMIELYHHSQFLIFIYLQPTYYNRGYCGHDRMVVGFTTTYAIGAYHH